MPESEAEANRSAKPPGSRNTELAPRVLYVRGEQQNADDLRTRRCRRADAVLRASGKAQGRQALSDRRKCASKAGSGEAPTDAVLVSNYSEAGATPEASEVGWIGGAQEARRRRRRMPDPQAQRPGVPRRGRFQGIGHGGKEGVVAFDAFEHEEVPVIDAFQFGPGGNATGCPHASVTPPSVEVKAVAS